MFLHLTTNANVSINHKKVFKMKHINAWEYKVTVGTERVYYILDSINHVVLVYYAGRHPC
jgi:hypothetical protein